MRAQFTIPASEVVPGMLLPDLVPGSPRTARAEISRWGWSAVTAVERCSRGDVHIFQAGLGGRHPPDEQVLVQLAGPSPRALLCTCHDSLERAVMLPGVFRPCDHVNRMGEPQCPVAPNDDPSCGPVHGGLRLWPAPLMGQAWIWEDDCQVWGSGDECVNDRRLLMVLQRDVPPIVRENGLTASGRARSKQWLHAFFYPPVLPTERELSPTPWAPYDDEVYL